MNGQTDEQALYLLWEKTLSGAAQSGSPEEGYLWHKQVRQLSLYGRGIEETLWFLFGQRPTYELFEEWLRKGVPVDQSDTLTEPVLSPDDMVFWEENGYIVLRNVIPGEACDAARQAIWEHRRASPDDRESWYLPHEHTRGMMLVFHHHPALQANRNSKKIRRAYEQLYGHTNIFPSIDKVSFNPPETDSYKFAGSPLHWDVSLQLPIPYEMQGLLYLNDVDETSGAFHCVPGFHKQIGEWLAHLPPDVNPRDIAADELQAVPVAGKAGDFIIWHQALPHCATANKGNMPRLVQYLTYKPVDTVIQHIWK